LEREIERVLLQPKWVRRSRTDEEIALVEEIGKK